jgi:lipopolysaccharide exporter
MTDINRKMAKGASWLILFRMIDRGIGFVSTLILARLLIPADFGLVAMAMSMLAFVTMLSAFSFDIALIQNAQSERRHYDTAWTFNVFFGFFNALALLALALPVASFYNEPRVVAIMLALGINCAIQGFSNIGIVAFQKDLDLYKEFIFGVAKKMAAFIVTISLAFSLRSYWALIAGVVASSVLGVLLSYQMHPYRPRFCLQGRKELFHFSKWMLLNNFLISLVHKIPDFVIGKLAGSEALGIYTVAYEISNMPTTELVFPISRAVFPGYAKMAGEGDELGNGFLEVLSIILLITVPMGFGIIALAEPLVHVLLGEKWLAAIPLIQVLGIYGILRASSSNAGAIYLALGLPRLSTFLTLLFLAMMMPSLWWMVSMYGVHGAAYAVLLTTAIQVPIGFFVIMRLLRIGIWSLASVMWRPIVSGLIMAGTIMLAQRIWDAGHAARTPGYAMQLCTLIPLGIGIYMASVLGLWLVIKCPQGGESKILTITVPFIKKILQRSSAAV